MRWLVKGSKTNDALFFHYSGHGGRTKDVSGDELDGYDETVYPVDFMKKGHILDDTIHDELVKPLPSGCRLTAIFDSCHSGTAMDLPFIYDSNGDIKEPDILQNASGELFSHRLPNGMMAPLHDVYYFSKKLVTGKHQERKRRKEFFSEADVVSWLKISEKYDESITNKLKVMFSASKDKETAADAFIEGEQTGAMSYAFVKILSESI